MMDMIKVEQKDGKVVLNKEDFDKMVADVDSLIETLEVLSDKGLMEQIKESEKDIRMGRAKEIRSSKDIDALFV